MQANNSAANNTKARNSINRLTFGLGTIGRDMHYTMMSMFLMFYLTDVLHLPVTTMWYVTVAMLLTRIFDAFNDPFMGVIVDNTKSKFGKFKPWISIGLVLSSIFGILMFTDFGVRGPEFALIFLIIYVLWEISFTANDIAYWSMLPALSQNQKEREKIGAIARICANIGLFTLVVAITPVTKALGNYFGSMQKGYFVLAIIVAAFMIIFQLITLIFVKENRAASSTIETTSVKQLFSIIVKNDQLLWITISMSLFMIGYTTTTSFGQYYFKYIYLDENMYSVFAIILGLSQIISLAIFPLVSKKLKRKKLYFYATILLLFGYVIFFTAPANNMIIVGISGMCLFIGQAAVQLIMLMFIADTVEYGEWKLHKRNDSISLSLQPFINKLGAAIANGIIGVTIIISGIKTVASPADLSSQGIAIFKFSMFILPMICIIASYIVYKKKYIIDEEKYESMLEEISKRNK